MSQAVERTPEGLPADWAERTPGQRHSYRFLNCEKTELTREVGALAGFEPAAPTRGLYKAECRMVLNALTARGISGTNLGARATKSEIVDEIDARLDIGASGAKLTNIELALVARVLEDESA